MLSKVRKQFLDFFESKNHKKIDSFSIISHNDPTLLFINSGMAPLKQYFLQNSPPPASRLTNSQHCLRVGGKHNDLADVGYTKRHHTFFEMLGNFSFGDYFQKEAIKYAWEFLTEILKLDKNRLFVTVHPKDGDAFNIWSKIIDKNKIYKLEENVWSMGEIGPFGYCSEIFYDLFPGNVIDLSNGDRFLEIWNLVFMKFYTDGNAKTLLPKPCIDAGMGLERIVSIQEGVEDTYDISFFKQSLKHLQLNNHNVHSKIFLDHLRSSAFMITEEITPGATEKEYILRRLLRRLLKAFFNFKNLDLTNIATTILQEWQKDYPNFQFNISLICKILNEEQKLFVKVLENGMNKFEEFFAKNNNITAQQAFILHDTYGFSIDIVIDLLKIRGIDYDLRNFEKIMKEYQGNNRKKIKNSILSFPNTIFIDEISYITNLIGLYEDNVVLDKTPFYAEAGGQVADTGIIEALDKTFKLKIIDVQKMGQVFIHRFQIIHGIPIISQVIASIDFARRKQITYHHSGTHLLNAALCEIFGNVKQVGSFVCDSKLRFDFTHQETVSYENLLEIELLINSWIQENHSVQIQNMPLQQAIESGAKAQFSYDNNIVRTIKMGNRSFELCCGTHVNSLGEIGLFKITKISSVSAGIKRIEGCCGLIALKIIQGNSILLKQITTLLNAEENQIVQKIEKLQSKDISIAIEQKTINRYKIGMCVADSVNLEKQMKYNSLDILLAISVKEEKISLQIKINENIENLDARIMIKKLGLLIEAKGIGGKKDYAQTGGKKIIDEKILFNELQEIIKNI